MSSLNLHLLSRSSRGRFCCPTLSPGHPWGLLCLTAPVWVSWVPCTAMLLPFSPTGELPTIVFVPFVRLGGSITYGHPEINGFISVLVLSSAAGKGQLEILVNHLRVPDRALLCAWTSSGFCFVGLGTSRAPCGSSSPPLRYAALREVRSVQVAAWIPVKFRLVLGKITAVSCFQNVFPKHISVLL